MGELWRLIPEYVMCAGAVAALFADVARLGPRGAARLGALAAAIAAVATVAIGPGGALFGGMLGLDEPAVFARAAVAGFAAVWLLWLAGRGAGPERASEAVSLALLSALGGMLVVSARDLVALFISLELSTMPAYVLMGYRRQDARGLEGALKYFLLSMLTSLVMLYGLSFVYGLSGATAYAEIALGAATPLRSVALVLALVGLLAKVSAAPFHYWTPDAYAGAPAPSVAFVSTVPKVAGTVALIHLVSALVPAAASARGILVAAALLSMLIGNLAAYPQADVRRLMAYSGVAHTGYILVALASGSAGDSAAVYYAVAYAVPSMAVVLMAAEEGTAVDDAAGLASRRPALAWASVAWLMSLIGIPPLVGFFGKLYVFSAALSAGLAWVAVVAVVMSAVSAGYYFRIIRAAFLGERPDAPLAEGSLEASAAFTLLTAAALALGVFASPLVRFLGMGF